MVRKICGALALALGSACSSSGTTDAGTTGGHDAGPVVTTCITWDGGLPVYADAGCDSDGPVDAGYNSAGMYVGDNYCGSCSPVPGYVGNSQHVGAYCTQGGGQCPAGLFCSVDLDTTKNDRWCLKQCTSDADCGENANCRADNRCVGNTGQKACVPNLCPP